MSAKGTTLKGKDGVKRYPQTVSALVYDNETGETVKKQITDIQEAAAELKDTVETELSPSLSNLDFDGSQSHIKIKAALKAIYEFLNSEETDKTALKEAISNAIDNIKSKNIQFEDSAVKAICIANFDNDGDGELSAEEAASITSLNGAFSGNDEIQSFNEFKYFTGVKSVRGFTGCGNLKSIELPNGAEEIRQETFACCYLLERIIIPNSVTRIADNAFCDCWAIKSLDFLPSSVTELEESSFGWCNGLIDIEIPNHIVALGNAVFQYCENLIKVTIGSAMAEIGMGLFAGCSKLESIIVSQDNPKYDSRDNCNAIIETETNTLIAGCIATIIPQSVTRIGAGAFIEQPIESIVLPPNVSRLDILAFGSCYQLKTIKLQGAVRAESRTFEDLDPTQIKVLVPNNMIASYRRDSVWRQFNLVGYDPE